MYSQIARPIGAVVAALIVTVVHPGSLVKRQVGPFVRIQIGRPVSAVIAALMVTLVHLESLVGRQVGLFVRV